MKIDPTGSPTTRRDGPNGLPNGSEFSQVNGPTGSEEVIMKLEATRWVRVKRVVGSVFAGQTLSLGPTQRVVGFAFRAAVGWLGSLKGCPPNALTIDHIARRARRAVHFILGHVPSRTWIYRFNDGTLFISKSRLLTWGTDPWRGVFDTVVTHCTPVFTCLVCGEDLG